MEVVSIFCRECDHRLGGLLNLWTRIGEGYLSPVVQTEVALDISADGAILHGEKGTIVDDCRVQELICTKCRAVLGTKCLSSAANHILAEGSLFLRTSSIQIADLSGYLIIEPIIQRVLSVKNDDHEQEANENPRLGHIQKRILSTNTEIQEIRRSLLPLTTQSNLEQESSSIRNAIFEANASLRVEFSGTWEKHHQKLKLLESELENIRRDQKLFQTLLEETAAKAALSVSDTSIEEIAALKTELEHLKQELALERSHKSSFTNPVSASNEMDVFTSNITKIGHRASQVESFQTEFELLKGRVQRLEAQTPTGQRDPTTRLQGQELQHSRSVTPKHKLPPSCGMEDGLNSNIASSSTQNVRDSNADGPSSLTVLDSSSSSPASAKAPTKAPTKAPRPLT